MGTKCVESPYKDNPLKGCWLRRLEIILTSKKIKSGQNQIIFGKKEIDNYNISVEINKYPALNKDSGLISISNLEYDVLAEIQLNEYYIVEVKAGYLNPSDVFQTYFKGEISYITQKIHSKHDVTTYFQINSSFVARAQQTKINYSFNSSVNIYAALQYLLSKSGIENANISDELRKEYLQQVKNGYDSPGNIIEKITDQLSSSSGLYVNTDESGNVGSLINMTTLENKKIFEIDPNHIIISKGNPMVSSSGIKLTVLPTHNFSPGDLIHIDNSLIDLSSGVSASSLTASTVGNYIDPKGEYMIQEIRCMFQNRGSTFEVELRGRALSLLKNLLGSGGTK